ncbi:MAG: hypothetical protein KY467_04945 [Gemmatimonadetes bacterium]|nr:hypothetical protein [Gemmatimonadota bacterium]
MDATDLARTFDAVAARRSRSADHARLLGAFAVGVAGAFALRGLLRARAEQEPPEPAPDDTVDEVDEASDESFPASDPPSYTPTHAGSPDHAPDRQPKDAGR